MSCYKVDYTLSQSNNQLAMMLKIRINVYSLFCLTSALIVHALVDPDGVFKTDNLMRYVSPYVHMIVTCSYFT